METKFILKLIILSQSVIRLVILALVFKVLLKIIHFKSPLPK